MGLVVTGLYTLQGLATSPTWGFCREIIDSSSCQLVIWDRQPRRATMCFLLGIALTQNITGDFYILCNMWPRKKKQSLRRKKNNDRRRCKKWILFAHGLHLPQLAFVSLTFRRTVVSCGMSCENLPRMSENLPQKSWFNFWIVTQAISTNGELLIWGLVVWDSNRVPRQVTIPFIFGDPQIQTTGTQTNN